MSDDQALQEALVLDILDDECLDQTTITWCSTGSPTVTLPTQSAFREVEWVPGVGLTEVSR